MHNNLLFLHDYSDNITYMAGGTTVNGESRGTMEAIYSAYEVPLNSMQPAVRGNKREDRNYESLEATYALPYEYATLGPNEAKVLANQFCIQHSNKSKVSYCDFVV